MDHGQRGQAQSSGGIETGEDPRIQNVARDLFERLKQYAGLPVNDRTIGMCQQLLRDCRVYWRHKGVDVPRMTLLVLPTEMGTRFQVYRADLEIQAIQKIIVATAQTYPDMKMEVLALAISRAFPDYKPEAFKSKLN